MVFLGDPEVGDFARIKWFYTSDSVAKSACFLLALKRLVAVTVPDICYCLSGSTLLRVPPKKHDLPPSVTASFPTSL